MEDIRLVRLSIVDSSEFVKYILQAECREHLALKKTIKNFEADKPNTTNIPILSTDFLTGTRVTYDGTSLSEAKYHPSTTIS